MKNEPVFSKSAPGAPLFPGLSAELLATVNQLLPEAGGIGTGSAKGRDSTSSWSPSWLTRLTEDAAIKNNEVVH